MIRVLLMSAIMQGLLQLVQHAISMFVAKNLPLWCVLDPNVWHCHRLQMSPMFVVQNMFRGSVYRDCVVSCTLALLLYLQKSHWPRRRGLAGLI